MMKIQVRYIALACGLALAGSLDLAGAQPQQALVIRGGTLIDGNGGAPLANSVVVIQGNQITAVGRAGDVNEPAGAQVIDAAGKFVLPGLWDSQMNYSWYWGELFLHHGVTSGMDIGLGGEVALAEREAVNAGHSKGPRTWTGLAHFGGAESDLTGYETALDPRKQPKTMEELQATTRTLLDAGADMIMFHDGRWDPAWVKWACDEAHRRGKACTQRASGPRMMPADAAAADVDIIPHSRGVDMAVARDGFTSEIELERWAVMDEAKARAMIALLAREQVYLLPTVIHLSPGLPRDWPRMQDVYERLFNDPNVLANYDPGFVTRIRMTRYGYNSGGPIFGSQLLPPGPDRDRRLRGYQNMLRFHKMYVEAGGKILAGGDTNGGKVPGSIVHEEMATFQEAGIPRMQVIQSATKWPAEAMRVADRIGTVERGKLADILIVNANPLQDIWNLRNIHAVVQNGKVVDQAIHAAYTAPFRPETVEHRHTVNDRKWVRALKRELLSGANAPPDPPASPQPAIEALAPTAIVQGTPTSLRLTGFNFTARTRVYYDGEPVPFERVSPTEFRVTLDGNQVGKAGRYPIVVKNPPPVEWPQWGNGTSNTAYLIVKFR
jgi:hypothetical protein